MGLYGGRLHFLNNLVVTGRRFGQQLVAGPGLAKLVGLPQDSGQQDKHYNHTARPHDGVLRPSRHQALKSLRRLTSPGERLPPALTKSVSLLHICGHCLA